MKSIGLKNIIVFVLVAILIAMIGLFIYQRKDYQVIVGQLNNEKDSIRTELLHMLAENDSIKTDNVVLNENLMVTQNRIKDLLIEVEQVKKISYQEITSYQNQVNTLRGIMRDLYNQIDSLNERNKVLYAENQEVKQLFNDEKVRTEQLEREREKLEQTVKKAQMLEALNLNTIGLTPRERESNRVASIQKLQISFTLSKNLTAKRGAKPLYIRIMRPDQLLLIESENNLFPFEDIQIPYSAMREVIYEGDELPVNIYWDNTGKPQLVQGTYTVDVFADGYNIGTSTFVLRH
jgi:hypothetical protein